MPRKRWIDKNNATTFQLLYRSQDDPLLNDESVSDRALFPISGPGYSSSTNSRAKGLHLHDLEDEIDLDSMRENEGEAAQYGIYFDDTKYDYMQHLRDIGETSGDAHFIDATPVKFQGKGKGKAKVVKLEDALREMSMNNEEEVGDEDAGVSVFDDEKSSFSRSARPRTYQDQQDVPDDIAGFQPDMDPRLREVLEALDDDAYIDEKDEDDIFGALTQGGPNQELGLEEFQDTLEDNDDGWDSDATEKPSTQEKQISLSSNDGEVSGDDTTKNLNPATTDTAIASAEDGDWLRDFAKFKRDSTKKQAPEPVESVGAASGLKGPASTLYTLGGTPLRQKRRKGALTNPSAYSMTSSSLMRTEGQQLLDARFEKIEAMYNLDEADEFDDDGGMSLVSGMSGQSKISQLSTSSFADGDVRTDLDGMMDGFLESWDKGHPGGGKRKGAKGKRGKNGNEILGIKMLDEIRGELGPARLTRPAKV